MTFEYEKPAYDGGLSYDRGNLSVHKKLKYQQRVSQNETHHVESKRFPVAKKQIMQNDESS